MATQKAFQEQLNPFEIAKQQFNRAADYLDLDVTDLNDVALSAQRSPHPQPYPLATCPDMGEGHLCTLAPTPAMGLYGHHATAAAGSVSARLRSAAREGGRLARRDLPVVG